MSSTVREAAAMMNVSVATVYKARRFRAQAEKRGCLQQYESLVMDKGKSLESAASELMPDLLDVPKHKQAITQFRSTVKKLIQTYGHSVEELTDYILEQENIYKHERHR